MEPDEYVNLDDPQVYPRFDPEGMLTHLHNFPTLCRQAWDRALDFKLPEDYSQVKKIVVLGMGGSAIGGDLISSLVINETSVPVLVSRDYSLPRYVDKDTLVIASSYSGNTEETLSAFEQACGTPAKKLAITTGGKLKSFCENMKVPVFEYDYRSQPRAALPFGFFTLLGILRNLSLLEDKSRAVSETLEHLDSLAARVREEVPEKINPAKSLARKLLGRIVIVYGAGITAEVAHRWKTQINENSNTMAFHEVFSELNHNAVVGYALPEGLTRQSMVVMLDSDLLHERLRLRYVITQRLLEQAGIHYHVLNGEGPNTLCQMMGLVLMGDYVSYYLAILNRVDPTPVKAIDFLKNSLSNK